ncbi:fatty acid desaturase [Xylophilus sp. GOD-11R]|uniref:fatty acid desaturase n=1 Tax=Xylophilus sp. GOD-11R TaxID=3089814 RepID=UPI00298D04FF|nr:fatty acid desaturase [Xylophilus sp. GOD-11R]WPB56906.1 fatty acid desaturase [Xylophilus sp. GOD-11R]
MPQPDAFRLKAAELLPLSVKSDRPGLLQAAGHLGAIVLGGALIWQARGSWWMVPATLLQGWFIAFLFNVLHETAHQTAFRTRAFNYAMGHLAGFAILLPYEYYRAFHWDHHRYTQDPARDPELSVPPPPAGPALAWYWTGIPTWISRVRMLSLHGLRGIVRERWVPEAKRGLIAREARFYLAGYAIVLGASLATQSLAVVWLWLLPVAVGQWLLRPYLLSEHTGCAYSADMLENTRTTYTNAAVRFFAWNMPFHVEHHAYPAVPFHALPRLNGLLASHIRNTEQGYPASTAAALRFLASEEHAAALAKPTTSP